MRFPSWMLLFSVVFFLASCRSTQESQEGESATAEPIDTREPRYPQLELAAEGSESGIRTIQLYRTGNESNPPFLFLSLPDPGSGERPPPAQQTLTLEFDIMDAVGRPLSVYFYHADRLWQRDYLQPVQYLATFNTGDLLDYRTSRATQVPYTHYTYRFPNTEIQFLVSGNYILRVTEQNDEEAVLFERPFVISEGRADLGFNVQPIMVSGNGGSLTQPIARVEPPSSLSPNMFDYHACFLRNARFEVARCSERPSLIQSPLIQFYLEPMYSFDAEDAIRTLDIGALQVGSEIRHVEYTTDPYSLVLEPDYAQLGSNLEGDPLFGQTVVSERVNDRADADLSAEYVDVEFQFVPPEEEEVSGPVVLRGSFNDWNTHTDNEMEWNEVEKVYSLTLRLKQGAYEYQYFIPDRRDPRIQRRNVFNPEYIYSVLLYYNDPVLNTDRLIGVQSLVSR